VQGPEPVQAPDHPANTEPAVAVAVRATDVPVAKLTLQEAPHDRPAGELVTVPLPEPETVSVSATTVAGAKVAVIVVALTGETVQVLVPVQPPPDQPVKTEPAAAVAVTTTGLPDGKLAEQLVPQEMPAGALVTTPLPSPARITVSVAGAGATVALTVVAVVSVSEQDPVPAQPAPDQPMKTQPAAGVAVSDTAVPVVKLAAQLDPQSIPAGALVTVPVPAFVTASCTGPAAAGNS
jgi:hypothetical protein